MDKTLIRWGTKNVSGFSFKRFGLFIQTLRAFNEYVESFLKKLGGLSDGLSLGLFYTKNRHHSSKERWRFSDGRTDQ